MSIRSAGLLTTDSPLEVAGLVRLLVPLSLNLSKVTPCLEELRAELVVLAIFVLIEGMDKVDVADYLLVIDGNVSRGLVSDMHIVSVLDKSVESPTHGYDVVIGVGRENDHSLGKWESSLRTIAVVSIGLATRPSGDGILDVIEDLNIAVICRAVLTQKVAKLVADIVLVGKVEERLAGLIAEPDESPAYQLVRPPRIGHSPRGMDPSQFVSCFQVGVDACLSVSLKDRCWDVIVLGFLDHLAEDLLLGLAPCQQYYMLGCFDLIHPYRDRSLGDVVGQVEGADCLVARGIVQHHEVEGRAQYVSRGICRHGAALPDPHEAEIEAAQLAELLLILSPR